MFECSYKFSEEDNVVGTVYTMKKHPQKPVKVLKWLTPILLLLNVGLLIWDIIDGEDIILDILLIIVLVACMLTSYCMPAIYRWTAKKTYRASLADKDQISIYMDENTATVSFYKGGTEVAKEVLKWSELTDYVEDEARIVLIFNLRFCVIRKDDFKGELDLFRMLLNSKVANNSAKK